MPFATMATAWVLVMLLAAAAVAWDVKMSARTSPTNARPVDTAKEARVGMTAQSHCHHPRRNTKNRRAV